MCRCIAALGRRPPPPPQSRHTCIHSRQTGNTLRKSQHLGIRVLGRCKALPGRWGPITLATTLGLCLWYLAELALDIVQPPEVIHSHHMRANPFRLEPLASGAVKALVKATWVLLGCHARLLPPRGA
jgi:hypothetical protein